MDVSPAELLSIIVNSPGRNIQGPSPLDFVGAFPDLVAGQWSCTMENGQFPHLGTGALTGETRPLGALQPVDAARPFQIDWAQVIEWKRQSFSARRFRTVRPVDGCATAVNQWASRF